MQLTNRRIRLMGTVIDVSIYHEEPEPLLDQVEALLHTYNKRFSANDDSSELMKINKAAGLHSVTVHPELFELIDLGALAKGYIADRIADFLKAEKVTSALINLGGNVLTFGPALHNPDRKWRIGIQNPKETRNTNLIVLAIRDQSIVTSGIYERTFEINGKTYHHIFDSQTGYPVSSDLASLTIISSLSVDGEIWTTRLFGSSLERIFQEVSSQPNLEAIIVDKDNYCFQTAGIYKIRLS